jgi:hypothetical protein
MVSFPHRWGRMIAFQFFRAPEVLYCNASGHIRPFGITDLFRDLQA